MVATQTKDGKVRELAPDGVLTHDHEAKIDVAGFTYEQVRLRIDGLSTLLQHNPQAMHATPGASRTRRVIPTPEEEAEVSCYRLSSGQLYVPVTHLRTSTLWACAGHRVKELKMSLKSVIGSSLIWQPEILPLYRNGEPITSYEIDSRRAVVMKRGIIRNRPAIPCPWELEVEVLFDLPGPRQAGIDLILETVKRAGFYSGIGDDRPSNPQGYPGVHGRYSCSVIE